MADARAPGFALGGSLLFAFAAAASAFAGHGLAIVGATVFDGTGRPALADGVVVIDGETIGAVGPRAHVALPKGIPYVDGRRLFVVPGRLSEARLRAALRRRIGQGARFEQALADVLRAEASREGIAATIERGRPADLLVLDKDPGLSPENLTSVMHVYVHGREVTR